MNKRIGMVIAVTSLSLSACSSSTVRTSPTTTPATTGATAAPGSTVAPSTTAPSTAATPSPATAATASTASPAADGSSTTSVVTTAPAPVAPGSVKLTLLSYDAFVMPDSIKDFTAATGIGVEFATGGGDAGTIVNGSILTAGKPQGDVLFGIDNTLLSRGVGTANLFVPYESKESANLDQQAVALVPGHQVTPIDTSDVCLNVDTGWFAAKGITPPATFDDLIKPQYKGLLVVENPGTSSTGLAFMLATVARYGPQAFAGYWKQLRANGVVAVDSWNNAYFNEFSQGGSGGKLPIVVSYATSPPYPLVTGDQPRPTVPTTANVPETCFRQIEFAGILAGTKHPAEARQLIDFMAGKAYQESLPLSNFVYPIRGDAAIPDVFTKFAPLAPKPWTISPTDIATNRDAWIEIWTKAVLR
jgi:thiamine transport system substrate-binding protein